MCVAVVGDEAAKSICKSQGQPKGPELELEPEPKPEPWAEAEPP